MSALEYGSFVVETRTSSKRFKQSLISNNDIESVELLLHAYTTRLSQVDIHIRDINGYTPLHAAAESGNPQILISLLQYPGKHHFF